MEIKIRNNDVIWSYLGSFFQFGTSVIILPIILSQLTKGELGLWYSFVSIGTLITYLDFGFSTTLIRNITYAWSGATDVKKKGFDFIESEGDVNVAFVEQIFFTCKFVCFIVAMIALIILLSGGTAYTFFVTRFFENQNTAIIAWLIYSVGLFLNLYYNYCSNALKGIGYFSIFNKILVFARVVQILITYVGLQLGGGLIAMSFAYLLSGFVIRIISNIYIRKAIKALPNYDSYEKSKPSFLQRFKESFVLLGKIWYNAKRSGVIALCSYFINQSLILICSAYLGVEESAAYGLCLQVITIIMSFSGILFATYSPRMINLLAVKKHKQFNRMFASCILIFWVMSISGIILFALFSTPVLKFLHSNTIIPIEMIVFMGAYMFLEHNHGEFTAYFTMKNDICYLKSYVISSILIVFFSWALAVMGYNIYILMSVHFIVQICYNNWQWPKRVFNQMNLDFLRFTQIGFSELKLHFQEKISNIL